MPIFSTLRSRRIANKKAQAVAQMIGFRLYQEWFALPILAIQKVVPLGKVYGDPHDTGVSITTYEEQELLVIDVVKQIFRDRTPLVSEPEPTNSVGEDFLDISQQRYLLILQDDNNHRIGLPIDSQPTMYRVETSAFKPLPEAYLDRGNIQCVTSEIIELPDLPPLFVLDPPKLISSMKKK
ncbi:CheW domain protein [Hyella patelloides LEGE 07179]|uniref:CheW domain protein n=1 Tax=Hyella patelloides LEGE 07179 TaxID=945734 RepID=A0A563W4M0_9CYAN|nr:chemotaxis protein CheW [Hyella patelloides]VEP18590.1 CheW domain protein [Hyella patelloides LEGE 07179]